MHYTIVTERIFFQGDIVKNVPLLSIPEKIQIARPIRTEEKREEIVEYTVSDEEKIADRYAEGSELVLAYGRREEAIILSQSCDIQNREFIIVAPILSLDLVDDPKRKQDIRDQKIFYRFYLPVSDFFQESFVDFTLLSSINKNFISIDERVVSLTDYWRSHLTWSLNRYFCRPHLV